MHLNTLINNCCMYMYILVDLNPTLVITRLTTLGVMVLILHFNRDLCWGLRDSSIGEGKRGGEGGRGEGERGGREGGGCTCTCISLSTHISRVPMENE